MVQNAKIMVAGLIGLLALTACTDDIGDRYVGFAQCLTDKDVVMYGAYWCPHCENQKARFGKEGTAKLKYVECDPRGAGANPELCRQKDVQGYPTWIFPDGSRVAGEMELKDLSQKTGCLLQEASHPLPADSPLAEKETTVGAVEPPVAR